MHIVKPAALAAALLFGLLLCADAWADAPAAASASAQAYAALPVCQLNADGTALAVEPCRTAPARVPMPRRPVPQIMQPLPRAKVAPPVAMPPAARLAAPAGTAAVPVTGCDAGGCNGANGVRYNNSGVGVVGPNGKVCTRVAGVIQC